MSFSVTCILSGSMFVVIKYCQQMFIEPGAGIALLFTMTTVVNIKGDNVFDHAQNCMSI